MDYKERYEKALAIACKLYNEAKANGYTSDMEDYESIFLELKESEDERIRKELIEQVEYIIPNDKEVDSEGNILPTHQKRIDKYRAWLEKQGKKTKPIEGFNTEFERQVSYLIASAMNKDYEYTKDFVKWTSEGLLNYAKLEIEKNSMGISEATKQKLEDSLNEALEKETPESWNKFLEKQGEQKSAEWKQDNIKELTEFEAAMLHIGESFFGKNHRLNSNDTSVVKEQAMLLLEFVANKPAWSEEDEENNKNILYILNQLKGTAIYKEDKTAENCIDWLKSLKDRVLLQPKQEWSEEDERITEIKTFIAQCNGFNRANREKVFEMLDALKDRCTWKPSDEQMDALHDAAVYVDKSMFPYPKGILMKLYKQLKKLREE